MKKITWLLVAFCLISLLTSSRPAWAAGVVGTGTAASCTEATLDAALAAGGSVTFNCGGGAVMIVITTTKTIALSTNINGGGLITISGNGTVSIFHVNAGVVFEINGLTIIRGKDSTLAGGINNYGLLTTQNTTIQNNIGGNVGGIYNKGTARIITTLVDGNQGGLVGGILNEGNIAIGSRTQISNNTGTLGGFYNSNTATIIDSTIRANTGQGVGGVENGSGATLQIFRSLIAENIGASSNGATAGIRNYSGTLTISNTTISGNVANANGTGGLAAFSTGATLYNVTITNNSGGTASSLNNSGGTMRLFNTIVHKTSSAPNCIGTFVDGGNNIQYSDNTCGPTIPNTNPRLGALASNGGPTQTHALLSSSPAIDAGSNAVCAASPVNNVDQRAVSRPLDGNGDGTAICDIGAYEK